MSAEEEERVSFEPERFNNGHGIERFPMEAALNEPDENTDDDVG